MTIEERDPVEEARAKLALWTYPYTGIDPLGFALDMDALIEAVRREERARIATEEYAELYGDDDPRRLWERARSSEEAGG